MSRSDAARQSQEREYWEEHAQWWQDEFTDGADPEYVEQILPIVAEHLGGARRVLDVGTGEGQLSRHLLANGARAETCTQPPLVALAGGGRA